MELIISAVSAIFFILFGWGKYQHSQRKKAESKAEQYKTEADDAHAVIQAQEEIQKAQYENSNLSDSDIDERLRKYDRDR